MKTVIRRGVFETNSSSSHSLTINKKVDGSIPLGWNGDVDYMLTDRGFAERIFLVKSIHGKMFFLRGAINAGRLSTDPLVKKLWKAAVNEYRKMTGAKGLIKEHIITEIFKISYKYKRLIQEGHTHEWIMEHNPPGHLWFAWDETGNKNEFRYSPVEPWLLCSWFYGDEPLGDCECQFGQEGALEDVFHLSTCKNFAEVARWYLSDDIYLVGGESCFDSDGPSDRII